MWFMNNQVVMINQFFILENWPFISVPDLNKACKSHLVFTSVGSQLTFKKKIACEGEVAVYKGKATILSTKTSYV